MKKNLLFILFIVFFAFPLQAQFTAGAKAGINLSSIDGDYDNPKTRISIHLGGYLNYEISDDLSFQPELLYSQVGARQSEKVDYNDGWVEYTIDADGVTKLNYLTIPATFKYVIGKINIQAGPQFGFLVSAKQSVDYKIIYGGEVVESGDEEDDIEDLKTMDLTMNIGLGADFDKISVSMRYGIGLNNVSDINDTSIRNKVLQLSVGYRLFEK